MIVGSPFSKTPSSFIQHSCATSSSEYYVSARAGRLAATSWLTRAERPNQTQDNFNMNQTCEKGVRTIIYFPPWCVRATCPFCGIVLTCAFPAGTASTCTRQTSRTSL